MGRGRPGVLLLLLATGAACRDARTAGAVRLAQAHELYSLDPVFAADASSRAVLCNIYEGLVAFDGEMRIVPALATHWSAPDDHTWVFELRPGAAFHDGRPLAPADVKFSLERVAGGLPEADPVARISAVEIPDGRHVKLRTSRPDPLLLNRLTQLLVVQAGEDPNQRPIGTGPYRIVRRGPGILDLEAFPRHWAGRPAIPRASVVSLRDEEAASTFERREIDVYRLLSGGAARRLAASPGVRVVGRPGLAVTYLWFDCRPQREGAANPFADARVRRAVSLALDREEIVRRLGGRDLPAYQPLPKGVFGYMSAWKPSPPDPEAARRLLREAGLGRGVEARLAHAADETHRALAAAVREILANVRIRVVPEEMSWLGLLEGRRDARLGFFALSWTFDDGDAWSFLMASLHSRRGPADLRSTNPGYSNPTLDRLIEESFGVPTIAERLHRYEDVLRFAQEDLPLVPVYGRHDLYGVSSRIAFEPRLDGKLVLSEMRVRAVP
jgi:peptide/nickel transport system substrate-binding protein